MFVSAIISTCQELNPQTFNSSTFLIPQLKPGFEPNTFNSLTLLFHCKGGVSVESGKKDIYSHGQVRDFKINLHFKNIRLASEKEYESLVKTSQTIFVYIITSHTTTLSNGQYYFNYFYQTILWIYFFKNLSYILYLKD